MGIETILTVDSVLLSNCNSCFVKILQPYTCRLLNISVCLTQINNNKSRGFPLNETSGGVLVVKAAICVSPDYSHHSNNHLYGMPAHLQYSALKLEIKEKFRVLLNVKFLFLMFGTKLDFVINSKKITSTGLGFQSKG